MALAEGGDAVTGPLLAMNLVGRDGRQLKDVWRDGPQTYLGLAAHGFPNLFLITGPQSPSVSYNMPMAIEDHVEFAANVIKSLRERGASVFDATPEAAEKWGKLVLGIADQTLFPQAKSSWYMGANVPGKPRVFMPYIGGFPVYVQKCNEVMSSGFNGFVFEGARNGNAAPEVRYTERWRVPIDIDVISPAAVAARRVPVV